MLKKLMAKVGIGAAKVDLRLDRDSYRLGETLSGVIHVEGGNVEQRIAELSVILLMKAHVKGQEIIKPVKTIPVLSGFTVQPKPFTQEVPFTYPLPLDLAVSTHSIQYCLQTKLDVELALDPTDMDRVILLPPTHIEKVFQALERLDFRQKADSGKLTPYGQEFSFFPARMMSVPLRELEVIFFEAPGELRLLVELDLAHGGMFRREVERKAEIVVPQELLSDGREEELAGFLMEKIEQYATNPHSIPYFSLQEYRGGYHGHHAGHGIGGMMGGMAAGLLGGMLLSEMMEGADDLFGAGDFFGGDEDGGDGGDFGGFDEF